MTSPAQRRYERLYLDRSTFAEAIEIEEGRKTRPFASCCGCAMAGRAALQSVVLVVQTKTDRTRWNDRYLCKACASEFVPFDLELAAALRSTAAASPTRVRVAPLVPVSEVLIRVLAYLDRPATSKEVIEGAAALKLPLELPTKEVCDRLSSMASKGRIFRSNKERPACYSLRPARQGQVPPISPKVADRIAKLPEAERILAIVQASGGGTIDQILGWCGAAGIVPPDGFSHNLPRLFHKGRINRQKKGHAFFYFSTEKQNHERSA